MMLMTLTEPIAVNLICVEMMVASGFIETVMEVLFT